MNNGYVLAFMLGIFSASSAKATCPLLDLLEYEGKIYPLAYYTSPPGSQKLADWVRGLPWCSAPGQGRAVYRIDGKKVFLVKFRGCASELSVADAYPEAESKLLANWLDGKIDVARGSCNGGWDPATESVVVRQGELVEFVKKP